MSKSTGRIAPFNPGSMDPEDLEALLVGRKEAAARLVERIATAAKERTSPPQQLVIGPRGYGKTHLLHVIYNRLVADKSLRKNIVIALLKEEEHVHSYLDLLRRILEAIRKKEDSGDLMAVLDRIYNDPSSKSLSEAEEFLEGFIEDRLLVVMLENLGDIFDGIGQEGQKRLRSLLQEFRKVSLFATAQRLFEPHIVRTMPFYGFFDRSYLDPFGEEEAQQLMKCLAEMHGDPDLLEFLDTPLGRARVNAVRELTGGNPRLITLLSGFLNRERLEELTGAFVEFVETSLTPYYQEQLNRLASPLHKRIVEILCERGDGRPLTVKEIARRALTTSQSISKQLARMVELGVLYSKKRGRETYYGMAEPLWRVSIEVKNRDQGILRIVVEFLKIIKTPHDLFTKLTETDAATLQSFQRHWTLALKESLGSLGKEEKDDFQMGRIQEICDCLPDDPAKAERLAKVLADSGIKSGEAVRRIVRAIENKEAFSELEVLGAEDELEYAILAIFVPMKDIVVQDGPLSQKEKSNFYKLLKWGLLGFNSGKFDTSILIEIDTENCALIVNISTALICSSNGQEAATNWLLKILEENEKLDTRIKAIKFLLNVPSYFLDIFFSILTKASENFLCKLLIPMIDSFLYACEKENKLSLFFKRIGERLSIKNLGLIVFWIGLHLTIEENFSAFWEKNKQIVFDGISQWKGVDADYLLSILADAEAFANGDADALASWPLEIRKQIEEVKRASKLDVI